MPRSAFVVVATLVATLCLEVVPAMMPPASAGPICETATVTGLPPGPIVVAPPCVPYGGALICQLAGGGTLGVDAEARVCVPAPV